jgi:hypothetical protein
MNRNRLSVLILLVGLGLPGCGTSLPAGKPATPQNLALAEIERLHGRAVIDREGGRLLSVNLRGTLVTDDDLRVLAGVKGLRVLSLNGTQITDAGLVHLRRLTDLEVLDLGLTRISDAGLKQLRHMANLRVLNLLNTNVTDAGLRYVEALSALRQLNVERTATTVPGARTLQESLPELRIQRDVELPRI